MAAVTALRGGNPGLTSAPSQNSAPVHEFQCLYSRDLRKKRKTWRDGSLRFHTFNKRVMVYDESKNYIGDAHWREGGELRDGTELELDRGVLVEVGERLGTTETDLAPLLEKRRPDPSSSPTQDYTQPFRFPSTHRTSFGLGRPPVKSLSAILGASQGPIGRARLPLQSPYERRHNLESNVGNEVVPAKKRRLASGKENSQVDPTVILIGSHLPIPKEKNSAVQNSPGIRKNDTQQSPPLQPRVVTAISSDDSTSPTLSNSPFTSLADGATNKQMKSLRSKKPPRQRIQTSSAQRVRADVSTTRDKAPSPLRLSHRQTPSPSITFADKSTTTSKTRLRLALPKPRMKLMYRELLPSSKEISIENEWNQDIEQKKHTQRLGWIQCSKRAQHQGPLVPVIDDAEIDCNEVTMELKSGVGCYYRDGRPHTGGLAEPFVARPNPLLPPDVTVRKASSQALMEHLQRNMAPLNEVYDAVPASHSKLDSRVRPGLKNHTSNIRISETISQLRVINQRLIAAPPSAENAPSPRQQEPPNTRPLGRVMSESDGPSPRSTSNGSVLHVESGRALLRGQRTSPQKVYQTPAKLTKSLSDPTPMCRTVAEHRRVPFVEEPEEDLGPWSKNEAYLLFDWWPPGREKPIHDAESETGERSKVVKPGTSCHQIGVL